MKPTCCCGDAARDAGREEERAASSIASGWRPRSVARRWFAAAEWLIPSVVLALMPKCPLCVAAYLAIATGIGVSTAVAGYLRTALILLCAAMLCIVAVRRAGRMIRRSSAYAVYRLPPRM
jgi:hypothetical protein